MTTFPFSTAVRAGRAALQWRLLLVWIVAMLIPTALLTLPMLMLLQSQLDYSVHAAEIAYEIDLTVLTDLMAAQSRSSMAFTNAGIAALIVTLLLAPFLSAMAACAARSPTVLPLRALCKGALDDYSRMARMMVWSFVPLALAAAVGSALMDAAGDYGRSVILEADARLASRAALVATLLMLALVHATLDAGRVVLALDRRRASVFKAWVAGCRLLRRRPLAMLGAYLAITVVGLGLAALLAVGRINVSGATLAGLVGGLLLVQLAVAVIGWMRSARLFALIAVARSEPG